MHAQVGESDNSGGIHSLKDLALLKNIGAYGVVIGKALYEGVLSLKEALKIAGRREVPLTKRIIPCLDVDHRTVVKGVHFLNLKDAGRTAAL